MCTGAWILVMFLQKESWTSSNNGPWFSPNTWVSRFPHCPRKILGKISQHPSVFQVQLVTCWRLELQPVISQTQPVHLLLAIASPRSLVSLASLERPWGLLTWHYLASCPPVTGVSKEWFKFLELYHWVNARWWIMRSRNVMHAFLVCKLVW